MAGTKVGDDLSEGRTKVACQQAEEKAEEVEAGCGDINEQVLGVVCSWSWCVGKRVAA